MNLLESEGKLMITKRGKIMLPDGKCGEDTKTASEFVEGIFESNQRGFGFLRVEGEEDIFIPESCIHGAMHTDRVQVKIVGNSKGGHHREGEVVKILQRGITEVVGIYKKSKSFGFVISDNTEPCGV